MTEELNEVPSTTPDFTTEAASQLAELFPEVVADGKINLDALKTILDIDVEEGRERFGLTWPGKREAIRAAQTPTTATLMPDKEESVDWDTTQNVFIEGDNLEVLKVLQKHYYGQIKMIYIDPPYNTGNDFVYNDDYSDPIGSYLELTGQTDEGGKLSTNSESAGRFHSNWLNMMYPRLKLAKNLLSSDGMIFISIDDREIANLRKLCEEIFGENNFVGEFIWKKGGTGKNDSQFAVTEHEYVVAFARSITTAYLNPDLNATVSTSYNYSDDHGNYSLVRLDSKTLGYVKSLDFEIKDHQGRSYFPEQPNSGAHIARWRWSKDKVHTEYDSLVFKDRFVYTKNYQKQGAKPRSLLADERFGVTRTGKAEAEAVLKKPGVFDFPKPVRLVRHFIQIATDKNSLLLDFFAGSGTTAHAAMELNAEDGGARRCISVQLPEPTGEKSLARQTGYETISEISRERIRLAGKKILEEEGSKLDGRADSLDVGFRAYKLVDTNFTKWKADSGLSEDDLVGLFSDLADSANDHARPEALLTEVLLKLGFSLTEKIETVEVAGLSVFSVADGLVMAYLDEHTQPTLDQLRALAAKEPERLVVLEDAFQGNDELKTNLVQECRTRNVDLWTA